MRVLFCKYSKYGESMTWSSVCVCCVFSDWSRIRVHADRDDVYGLRKGESGGCATGQFQQPPQSCGVPSHCESLTV